jgi:hypothetical protein
MRNNFKKHRHCGVNTQSGYFAVMHSSLFFPLILWLTVCTNSAFSQERYGTGLIFEEDIASKIPQRAVLLTRSYENLPAAHSLKAYAPKVMSQGRYGTCTGWASTYAARTIAEAYANGWTDKEKISDEAYSAMFTYGMVRRNPGCENGTAISEAVRKLKEVGAVKRRELPDSCPTAVLTDLYQKAGEHRIFDCFTTFSQSDPPNFKVAAVKKAISENRPVVAAMSVYESFKRQGKGVWNGFTTAAEVGGHAMCVVGYNDALYGGAFEIMNSWGTNWGDMGFVWVKYDDFGKHSWYGHDIYIKKRIPAPAPAPAPQPQPAPQPKPAPLPQPAPQPQPAPLPQPAPPPQPALVQLSGALQFKLSNGDEMPVSLQNKGGVPTYKTKEEYIAGTRFRIYLSNNNPAYVYVVGSDLNNEVSMIFPHNERTSAALFYKSNDIALPDEKHLFELDNTKGTTYALVLYSESELPINEIVEKIRGGKGNFTQKVLGAVGGGIAPFGEVALDRQSIKFSSKSVKPIVAIAVEVDHTASGH